ncbi:uncharacterized protein [Eurosta solidaginis]|uniref:uncharacterized protein n=1 Tax=Eurosta solidaginis TaxID=178769 RepID=UPI0035306872
MPQEGLNVFYRFFRDRISWFEADAVCQFHHANLVTVDNSFQFDATRDLLRELDVNDIVWIGLMRPQSSERFMWSNSRPLVTDTGYWAESLPLMDAPLCAVIDPIRDYRWHALRCGGPETASFLCEMLVPAWADSCILKDMPNLTLQYMADTASIELIRNCAEEGLLKQSCKGKQDRDRALRELICPRERLEAQRINDITNSHFKSLQIINSIRTDNNENNNIELLPLGETSYGSESNSDPAEQMPTEENTVQRLIEQFNVDELMQADEPSLAMSGYHIPGEIPKPIKKAAKKVIVANGGNYQKKNREVKYEEIIELPPPTPKPKKQQQLVALEDMMLGDQPQQSGEPEMLVHVGPEDGEVSNEIMEPLPHIKRVLPNDLKTMAPITEKLLEEAMEKRSEKQMHNLKEDMQHKIIGETTTTPVTTTTSITTVPTTTAKATTTTTTSATTVLPVLLTSTAKFEDDTQKIRAAHHAQFITTITPSTSAAPAHATESEDHMSSSTSSVQLSNTIAPHATQKSIVIDSTTSATEAPFAISHPMHPQQQHAANMQELQHTHVKESVDNSHFIPPMLLVKSHYIPPLKHSEYADTEHHSTAAHDMTHHRHEDIQTKAGKPSDNPIYSMTANYSTAATTTRAHMASDKSDETDIKTSTIRTVATTITVIKSTEAATTTTDDELTKKATDDRTSAPEQQKQQQEHHQKMQAQLNAKLIGSSTSLRTNQQQKQQLNGQQVNIKAQTLATDKMTEKIEYSEDIVPNANEHTTTAAEIATSASVANKLHSTSTTAAIETTKATATTTSTPQTTLKSADIDDMSHDDDDDDIAKLTVEHRQPQTKEVVEVTTKAEIPITTTKSTVEDETYLIATKTTQMDELQKIKEADATQILLNKEAKVIEREKASTTTTRTPIVITTAKAKTDSLATVTGAPSSTSTLATLITTKTALATAEAIATTSTHAIVTTTTVCNSDTDMLEATNTDATEQSSHTTDDEGKKLTRVHRTCQPRNEKNKEKHSKHHEKVLEPPTPTRNFLNEETESPPYKPNRHRVLTKPETEGYFKKIIG